MAAPLHPFIMPRFGPLMIVLFVMVFMASVSVVHVAEATVTPLRVQLLPVASASNQTLFLQSTQMPTSSAWLRYPHKTRFRSSDVDLDSWSTIAAIICGAGAAALSSAGGLGGGGLYVPIFNLLLGFDSKTSAALSNCMILGGIMANLIWYSMQKRPNSRKPLIDYQIALIFLPNVLLGISAGVICNIMSPGWLVTATLFVVLSFMTSRSCRNAFKRWDLESIKSTSAPLLPLNNAKSQKGYQLNDDEDEDEDEDVSVSYRKTETDIEKPLLENYYPESPQFPPGHIILLGLIWVSFLALQIARGSSDGQNIFGIETCGTVYWLITVFQVPLAFIITGCTITYLNYKTKEEESSVAHESGYSVTFKSMCLLSMVALAAGLLGGMLGLGGGMMISPLFIEMGMHPQVTAATCSFMVFFSSSLSVVQFWLLGRIPGEYAIFFAILALVFSVIGLLLVQTIIVRYGRVSLIVFSVSTVMGLSAILMAGFGSWDVYTQIRDGDYMGFEMPC